MTEQQIRHLTEQQRTFFATGATLPVAFRIKQLKKLYEAIKRHENDIHQALQCDLGKSSYEGFMCETGLVLSEITYMLRHIRRFTKKKTVHTPLAQFPSHSFQQPVPYGNTLIMSPWNYPFLLTMEPLTDAIAAGNTAIIKPSAYSPATGKIVEQILHECFPPEYIAVVTGGRVENSALLEQRFDLIFFTGSQSVGKEVLRKAAPNLTPVILELGGKSPCIVADSADIPLAAKRIVFGKFLNCGQTCVAPDYILCHRSIKDAFLKEAKKQIRLQYGEHPLENPNYGKIINAKHFKRLSTLIKDSTIADGGEMSEAAHQIAPTILHPVSWDDAIMKEEIFGPIMPILEFDSFDDLMKDLKVKEKPLALYLFSKNPSHIQRVTSELCHGGGCINDVVIHLATSEMGFGGVGASGMGSYHGKAGFDAFSHTKSMVNKKTWLDLPMRYQPYNSRLYEKLLHLFLK